MHKLLNWEDEEDGRNYHHLLNQICYIPEVREYEVFDPAGNSSTEEYFVDFFEYFDTVQSYGQQLGKRHHIIGEFVSLYYYLEDCFREDNIETDSLCDLVSIFFLMDTDRD